MDQIKIGKFISKLRHQQGMTQEAMGEKLGVTNKTISRWETGAYMPDIEMFKLLSQLFDVSINELLCGEIISNNSFRKKADENIVNIIKESNFSSNEKLKFWKQKWIKENKLSIIIYIAIFVFLFILGIIFPLKLIVYLSPIVWLLLYILLRNKMMIYIENKVYDNYKDKK